MNASGYCSLAHPGVPIALTLTLTGESCSLTGESPEFPYQTHFQSEVLLVLAGASTQAGMTYPQFQLLLMGAEVWPNPTCTKT